MPGVLTGLSRLTLLESILVIYPFLEKHPFHPTFHLYAQTHVLSELCFESADDWLEYEFRSIEWEY